MLDYNSSNKKRLVANKRVTLTYVQILIILICCDTFTGIFKILRKFMIFM